MKPVKVTWDKFKLLAAERCADKMNQWCYRGQQNATDKLATTFHRKANKAEVPNLDAYFSDMVIGRVRPYINSVLDRDIKLDTEEDLISFLALLQHHGFPTPILDWTLSPYIATYFAFRNIGHVKPKSRYVAVYAFNCAFIYSRDDHHAEADIKQDKIKYIKLAKPISASNPRLIPQQSICMITNIAKLEAYICKRVCSPGQYEGAQPELIKYLLDMCDRTTILKELNLMGINEMTMFPTVDGVCKYLAEKIFLLGDNGNL